MLVAHARQKILQIDLEMRSRYKTLKSNVQPHLGPYIIVANGPEGGTYWLVQNGKVIETVTPIDEIFQLAKSIAHIPLGTFSVLAPYLSHTVPDYHLQSGDMDPRDLAAVAFIGPTSTDWIQPIIDWNKLILDTRGALANAELSDDLRVSSEQICDAASRFIENAVENRKFTMEEFESFTGTIFDQISNNMYWAAKVQIDAVSTLMTRWKNDLNAQWHDVYVLVYSMWTTSVLNQNTIIIKNFMEPDRVDTHLIDIICDQLPVNDPISVGAENLARIVQDNIAAEMIFPTSQTTADALKGKEDLLSQEILKLLGEKNPAEISMAACPFARYSR
ncbi:MAG TPA: hypothetical protein DIW64_00770 [Cellvibrio sp.]|nr:hypothetical protein [Cellvibrio sp.]